MNDEFDSLIVRRPETPLFADLPAEARSRLSALTTHRSCAAGETLVTEGASDPFLYVIRHGRVRVDKRASDGGSVHSLGILGAGETLGEMKLAVPGPATATVTALEPVELLCVDLARLRADPDLGELREALLGNIARILSERLRGTSEKTADAMAAELREGRLRESAGRFIVYLFTITSGFAFFVAGLEALGPARPRQALLSAGLVVAAAIPIAVLLRRGPFPMSVYGLAWRGAARALRDSFVYTLPVLLLLVVVKGAWLLWSPLASGHALFEPARVLGDRTTVWSWLAFVLAYSFISVLQEFFARSGLQASIRLFDARASSATHWPSIIIANLIFASAHAYLGLRYMLAAFVPGLFWGWLFDRQRSLLGVSLSHALVGVWALFVMGLQVLVGGR